MSVMQEGEGLRAAPYCWITSPTVSAVNVGHSARGRKDVGTRTETMHLSRTVDGNWRVSADLVGTEVR